MWAPGLGLPTSARQSSIWSFVFGGISWIIFAKYIYVTQAKNLLPGSNPQVQRWQFLTPSHLIIWANLCRFKHLCSDEEQGRRGHSIEMLCTITQLQRDRMAVLSLVVPRWRQGCFWRHSAWKTTVTPSPHHPSLVCMLSKSHRRPSHSLSLSFSPCLAHFCP